jgi:hypothetical protein
MKLAISRKPSLPGLTRQSMTHLCILGQFVDARVEPGHDELEFALTPSARA